MNEQIATSLLRLRENKDAQVLFQLLDKQEAIALNALRQRNEVPEIYREQGMLRVFESIRQWFMDADAILNEIEE